MKIVIFNIILIIFTSCFAKTKLSEKDMKADKEMQDYINKSLDAMNLIDIDKVVPKEREYTKEELSGFIDDDNDWAEDRLERFFFKERLLDSSRIGRFRYVAVYKIFKGKCNTNSDICDKLYSTIISRFPMKCEVNPFGLEKRKIIGKFLKENKIGDFIFKYPSPKNDFERFAKFENYFIYNIKC